MSKVFLYQKDYTEKGRDRLFLWKDGVGLEVTAPELVKEDGELICHDYWLIAPSIYQSTGKLPARVLDVEDFRIAISGQKIERKERERRSIVDSLFDLCDESLLKKYIDIFDRRSEFDGDAFFSIAPYMVQQFERLLASAGAAGELDRYLEIEVPIFNLLTLSAAKGIRIDTARLREHKGNIEHEYYMALKNFAITYNLPFEMPSEEDVCSYLEPRGFDCEGVSLDYILRFVPMQDNFATDLLALKRLAESRFVLAAMPVNRKRAFPVVDIFGSITSRIYYRDPVIQNLAKRHRDIVVPDDGLEITYVDYDQFEVGIMAALSRDPNLLRLYGADDLYVEASNAIFGDDSKRKIAKRLFLSYAYGMRKKGLLDAAYSHGAQRSSVRDFFNQFSVYENWKTEIYQRYEAEGKIGTSKGNFLIRKVSGPLSGKEQRSSVSQVVQGTASLIFKKALLRLREVPGIDFKIPMHDAVLVQHPIGFDRSVLTRIFCEAMTEHFGGAITGKASLENYFSE
ncbi:TPA: hypothetical protein QDC27_005737 [Burkholderia cepacia ATCC 25416]|nr:hypothetical protein [Burkholderia cepacia ATCC 25416]HDR9777895.1 hypothetical protein [Burkholderia cepacia ATCC 25416]HDR9786288.1 hypothetical protein [Burkholderia cepacia ATCC 25416]HDR9795871.1 hypothetical protein [Burkholderia cepacia ATCC 25416]